MPTHPAFLAALPLQRRHHPSRTLCARRGTPRHTATATLLTSRPVADRSDFPILQQEINGHNLVYLESAATSQKPEAVIRALTGYYDETNANVHRGAHALAAHATDTLERTRDLLQAFIRAPAREELVFTRNATEGINLVARAWGAENLGKGDKVVVSVMGHHANLVPWQMAAAEAGAEVVPVRLTEGEEYDVADLERVLAGGGVKMAACSHVSNVLGCVNPVREIVRLAHAAGAVVLVDACLSVPNMPVDLRELGCDFLVASSHKMCGPTGVGFLWGRRELLEAMPPYMGGGQMIADVFLDRFTYADLPHKFEAGTPAIGEIVAFGAATEYLNGLGMHQVHRFGLELGEYLYERLTEFREVTVYGPPPPRAALCAFNVDGVHSSNLATMLDLEGVAVRSGHHCAQPLHRELGVSSSARASLYVYNTKEEIDVFIEALKGAVDVLGGTLTKKS